MNNKNPNPISPVVYSKTLQENLDQIEEKNDPENIYDKIKVCAVYQLVMQLLQQIEMKLNILDSQPFFNTGIGSIPHNTFMWTTEAWLERLQYGHQSINVLLKVANKNWLEQRKKQMDLRQLENFVAKLMSSYIEKQRSNNSFKELQSAIKYNEIEETLLKQLKENAKVLMRLKWESGDFNKVARTILKIKESFAKKSLEILLLNRIRQRYTKAYNNVVEEQSQMKLDLRIKKFTEEFEKYAVLKREDIYISACKLDTYYNNIQKIRMEIKKMDERYADEDRKVNEKRDYLLSNIEKGRTEFELIKSRYVLYKKRIELYKTGSVMNFKDLQDIKMTLFSKKYAIDDKSQKISTIALFELKEKT